MTIDEELSGLVDRFFRAVSFDPGGWRITSMAWDDEA
jgi:hypothetical protein